MLKIKHNKKLDIVPLKVLWLGFLLLEGLYRNDALRADIIIANKIPLIGKLNIRPKNNTILPINNPIIVEVK